MVINIKIEKYFGRYRAYLLVEDSLEPYCVKFTDDDYYELSKKKEIRCILEGDFTNLIESIYDRGYNQVVLSDASRLFIDKPSTTTKSDDPLKKDFRAKIIKKDIVEGEN